jgi:hypothetical protein
VSAWDPAPQDQGGVETIYLLQCRIRWTVSAGIAGFYLVVTKHCTVRTLEGLSEGEGGRDGIGGSQIARNVANQQQLSEGNTTRAAARISVSPFPLL